jgi:hypothetical protein
MSDRVESQLLSLRSLIGSTISQWTCIEMAFNESDDDSDLIWHHPTVPMLQLLVLYVRTNGTWHAISTYQSGDEWGICLSRSDESPSDARNMSPIFRFRELPELPTGVIVDVLCNTNDHGNIASVDLRLHHKTINLLAGEIYEGRDGSFEIKFMDESLLVQTDGHVPIAA